MAHIIPPYYHHAKPVIFCFGRDFTPALPASAAHPAARPHDLPRIRPAGLEPVRAMLREYETAEFSPKRMQELMCPVLNTRALERLGFHQTEKPEQKDGVIVLSPEYMDPYSSGDKVENLFCERTISIHHYSASWTSGRQRIKRRLIRIIGEDRLLWIRTMKTRAAAGKQK